MSYPLFSQENATSGDNIPTSQQDKNVQERVKELKAMPIKGFFGFAFSKDYHFNEWSNRSIFAIVYLAIFGSVITFYAYHYLLKNLLATQVSMLSYINTIIGIFLSWLILDEKISAKFIIATILIISGVFIINYRPDIFRRKKKLE